MAKLSVNRGDIRKLYTSLRDIAQKRIGRAKEAGLSTRAIKEHFQGFKKLADIGSNTEFKQELKNLKKFVGNRTQTTISGQKKVKQKIYNSLKNKMKPDLYDDTDTSKMRKPYFFDEDFSIDDLETFGTFMNLTDIADAEGKIMGSPAAVDVYKQMFMNKTLTKKERQKLLKAYAQTIYNDSGDKETTLKEINRYAKYMGLKTSASFARDKNAKRAREFEDLYRDRYGIDL